MKKVTKIDGVQKNTAINNKLRVAAYCRVSTGSDAQLESLEAQKSHYEQYINSREDWQFAGLYFDEGITGTKAEKRLAIRMFRFSAIFARMLLALFFSKLCTASYSPVVRLRAASSEIDLIDLRTKSVCDLFSCFKNGFCTFHSQRIYT